MPLKWKDKKKNLTQLHTKVTPHEVEIDYTHDHTVLAFYMEEFMSVGTQKELEVFKPATYVCTLLYKVMSLFLV